MLTRRTKPDWGTFPFGRLEIYGHYVADWLNRSDARTRSKLRQYFLLLLLSFGSYLKTEDQRAGKRKRPRWPDEVDSEVRSRLPGLWRNRVLDALSVLAEGPHPQVAGSRMPSQKVSLLNRGWGTKEWRVSFMVRFTLPDPERRRLYAGWAARDEVSAVAVAVAGLVQNRALHLVRPCSNCGRFFFARRSDGIFCSNKCRVGHWKRTLKGRVGHAAYMRQYRQNPKVRGRSGARNRNQGARAASTVRTLGNR